MTTSSPSKKFKPNNLIPLSTPQSNQFYTELPQGIIFMCILPCLSYKILSKLKCVSKTWYKIISDDAKFAQDQSLCASPLSCGLVFSQCHGNKVQFFNTFDSPIGFNICHHPLFKNLNLQCRRILASSCGLLCILFHEYADFASQITSFYLYVGNPATGAGEVLPLGYQTWEHNIGLAFDPSIEPNCYQLVQPLWHSQEHEYEFVVYSTKICEWVSSKERIRETNESFYQHRKPVTLKNIVYWDCYEYIISFDPWNDVASYIELPKHDLSWYSTELGTCNGRITFMRLGTRSMEVYVLDESEKIWETKHKVCLHMMFNSNQDVLLGFWHAMGNTSYRFVERLFSIYPVYPFPYEGGDKLFFRVIIEKTELFSYDLKLEKVSKFCEFQGMNEYPVLSYDRDYADSMHRSDQRVFTYHNSMVKVPVSASNKCSKIFW